jgi:myo-inositol-1(or 4)-monophosphatase
VSDARDYLADLELLQTAARKGAEIAMSYYGNAPKISYKEGMSPVTEADFAVDAYLKETLCAARPDYGWLSEETADSTVRLTKKRTFVVDPIDGTKAFIAGNSMWCVSVAIVESGRSIAGVLDCPVRKEVYSAALGQGAYKNGARLERGAENSPLVMSGTKALLAHFAQVTGAVPHAHSHIPSLAYRIAMIADGRLDGAFVKPDAQDWDLAAADLILAETGGTICGVDGSRATYGKPSTAHGLLVAAQASRIDVMLGVVANSTIG